MAGVGDGLAPGLPTEPAKEYVLQPGFAMIGPYNGNGRVISAGLGCSPALSTASWYSVPKSKQADLPTEPANSQNKTDGSDTD